VSQWDEITLELRTFIKEYIENGGTVLDETLATSNPKIEKQKLIILIL